MTDADDIKTVGDSIPIENRLARDAWKRLKETIKELHIAPMIHYQSEGADTTDCGLPMAEMRDATTEDDREQCPVCQRLADRAAPDFAGGGSGIVVGTVRKLVTNDS